jgi:arsenical pump membrane protein
MAVAAVEQAWPPFVLVLGLLLVGQVADRDGLFAALGARLSRAAIPPRCLLVCLLTLVAVVTAVLNLDTSVVFMTPVLVHAARSRGLDERPFLYGAVFMSNSASLLLPGSNLTNLLVLGGRQADGLAFARGMLASWLAACVLTAAVLLVAFRFREHSGRGSEAPLLTFGLGAASVLLTAAIVLLSPSPALPVLAVGVAAAALARVRPRLDARVLGLVFALAVALGVVARASAGPAGLLGHTGAWATAALAAAGANVVNNLPACMLLSARAPAHPRALLLGLNLGPNLAVTGSLSAYLWLRAARDAGARPSLLTYSRIGLVLVPVSLAAAVAALRV